MSELATAREAAALSHDQLARSLGWSATSVRRLFANGLDDPGVVAISQVASVLGYEISLSLYPIGDSVRDKGQLAVGRRFQKLLADGWRVTDETLLPGEGEMRAWDKLLRLVDSSPPYLVGVDIETRIRDIQALTRRTRARERDGEVDEILIVLADTATNRRLAPALRQSLGDPYANSPRALLSGLRSGERLVGSGVVLV